MFRSTFPILTYALIILTGVIPTNGATGSTEIRSVSGSGLQASAHGTDQFGDITDVRIIFNAPRNTDSNEDQQPVALPTLTVIITKSVPSSGQNVLNAFGTTRNVTYQFSRDMRSASLNAILTVTAPLGSENPQQADVSINLTWTAGGASENVKVRDTDSQPGYSMDQSLTAGLHRTTVSGSVLVNGAPIPLAQNATPAIWDTTNRRTTQTGTAGIESGSGLEAHVVSSVSAGTCASGHGSWTGYWTWDSGQFRWFWTWVWSCPDNSWTIAWLTPPQKPSKSTPPDPGSLPASAAHEGAPPSAPAWPSQSGRPVTVRRCL